MAAAAKNEISADVIENLLDLERDFKNLHVYGARPRFRRRIGEIVEAALQQARVATGG